MKNIEDLNVKEKRVFVRVDFNCPLIDGGVADDTRIRAAIPTIQHLIKEGAKVVLASHLGRPKGRVVKEMSLKPVAARLVELLKKEVILADDCVGVGAEKVVSDLCSGQIAMLENLRFHKEEEENDKAFAKILASLADVYINDAFGTAHRSHASTVGVPALIADKAPGFLMMKEIENLSFLLKSPDKPFVTIIGGAKVSDKVGVIENLLDHIDMILIGGGMAYTFLLAKGFSVGESLVDRERIEFAEKVMKAAEARQVELLLPEDHIIAAEISDNAKVMTVKNGEIPDGMKALDIGPETIRIFSEAVAKAKTIFWNGPMGVFESAPFAKGTMALAKAVAQSSARSVVGGGDSLAAINRAGVADRIGHISTGGGASLEMLEGKELPGVVSLEN